MGAWGGGKKRGFVTHNIRQLRLSNQVLRLCPHELLLQRYQLRALRLFALQPRNLIGDLPLPIATRLHALLRVPNLLQQAARIVYGMRIVVLLLPHLRQHDTDLVADIVDGFITRLLAPLRKLCGNGNALAAGGLVGCDEVVCRFDKLV